MSTVDPLIEIKNLRAGYWQQNKWDMVVRELTLTINRGEVFGLVGESGCGKSTTANALLGYRPVGCRYVNGAVDFVGRDMLSIPRVVRQRIVGREISLVPQNPATALSPGMRIGQQLMEALRVHGLYPEPGAARKRALELLELVRLKDVKRLFNAYPFGMSGGQQQRVLIAMALACGPKVVVLDEPTTGLDVTTQAEILDLLLRLHTELNMAMFYITHNLGVVATIADRIGVMYAGDLVEVALRDDLFYNAAHPYSQGLIASVPRICDVSQRPALMLQGILRRDQLPAGCPFAPRCPFAVDRCSQEAQALKAAGPDHWVACWRVSEIPTFAARVAQATARPAIAELEPCDAGPLLQIRDMRAGYARPQRLFGQGGARPKLTVSDINLDIYPGETLALVGESGSGKTTLARAVSGIMPHVEGDLLYRNQFDLGRPAQARPKEVLRSIQYVFQNPDASLNPRQRIDEIIGQPLRHFFGLGGARLREKVASLLADIRLPESYAHRFPDELSGGERQRIALGRALAADPDLILCDEILSALDVSVQASILDLLINLQTERRLTYLFISHDLAIVHTLAKRVAVIYSGRLCEVGETREVFQPPFHPYTRHLLEAVPEPDPRQARRLSRLRSAQGGARQITACPFSPYCSAAVDGLCQTETPPWQTISATHRIRCHADLRKLEPPIQCR